MLKFVGHKKCPVKHIRQRYCTLEQFGKISKLLITQFMSYRKTENGPDYWTPDFRKNIGVDFDIETSYEGVLF